MSRPRPCPSAPVVRGDSEAGMALIMAILALLLLTFLGLTLTATTSTELLIANNYRWSQQARYNAEAGLEAARAIISTLATPDTVLPIPRADAWASPEAPQPYAPPTAPFGRATRDFEPIDCDGRGNGAGYGAVLDDGSAEGPYENKTTIFGSPLQGGFTIWVRRGLVAGGSTGGFMLRDSTDPASFIVTAEGFAPSLTAPNRALQVMEATVTVAGIGDICEGDSAPQASQTGFAARCPAP